MRGVKSPRIMNGPYQPNEYSYPPATRNITLPGVVSVRFLIEASGQRPEVVTALMRELHILVDIDRSIDFGAARRVLRHFGVSAERGTSHLTI
jgi:hypothetical protein